MHSKLMAYFKGKSVLCKLKMHRCYTKNANILQYTAIILVHCILTVPLSVIHSTLLYSSFTDAFWPYSCQSDI